MAGRKGSRLCDSINAIIELERFHLRLLSFSAVALSLNRRKCIIHMLWLVIGRDEAKKR